MRLDSHQHFWQYNPDEHIWMSDRMDPLKRDFLPNDLKPLLDSLGFDGCVAVQARQNLEETRWLLQLADENEFIAVLSVGLIFALMVWRTSSSVLRHTRSFLAFAT